MARKRPAYAAPGGIDRMKPIGDTSPMRVAGLFVALWLVALCVACGDDEENDGLDCVSDPAACLTVADGGVGGFDEAALNIVRGDPAVAPILGARQFSQDYWLAVASQEPQPLLEERLVNVSILFREPVEYAGSVPAASDPCAAAATATAVASDHPCRSQSREYATATASWPPGTRALLATVDVDRGAVINLGPSDIPAERVDELIDFYDDYQAD